MYKNFNSRSWDELLRERNRKFPWASKINKAIWRGSATGNVNVYHDWRDLPRAQLVLFSQNNPNLLDAGFTSVSQWNETALSEMQKSGFMKKIMPIEDFQKFKAIVDIDGNSWSSRFVSLLCMNSIVLKVVPNYVEYTFFELQPWVHYVPVHGNLSNLEEMLRLATSDDKRKAKMIESIVRNANNWCRQKMTGSQMVTDMSWIINSYLEILQYEDDKSGSFTMWKDGYFRNSTSWNENNWIKIY
jgi:hypothetical protein